MCAFLQCIGERQRTTGRIRIVLSYQIALSAGARLDCIYFGIWHAPEEQRSRKGGTLWSAHMLHPFSAGCQGTYGARIIKMKDSVPYSPGKSLQSRSESMAIKQIVWHLFWFAMIAKNICETEMTRGRTSDMESKWNSRY